MEFIGFINHQRRKHLRSAEEDDICQREYRTLIEGFYPSSPPLALYLYRFSGPRFIARCTEIDIIDNNNKEENDA
jgi:hypothetical protein